MNRGICRATAQAEIGVIPVFFPLSRILGRERFEGDCSLRHSARKFIPVLKKNEKCAVIRVLRGAALFCGWELNARRYQTFGLDIGSHT